jgi:hypothetical protein
MPDTGPFLKAALFCDSVIEGKDGVLSLIRVVDRLSVSAAGADPPADMPAMDNTLTLVLMLISGTARGSSDVGVSVEPPGGIRRQVWNATVLMEGEDRGANIVAQIRMKFELQGLYWFHVQLDGEHLTSLPYRVIYQRVVPGRPPQ